MLLHAASKSPTTAAPNLRRIEMSVGLHLKYVEVPGTVIDEEAILNEIGAGAIVNLGPHSVGQAYLPAAKFQEWQRQSALPLASGVIDDDDMAGAVLTGPGRRDEAIRGPVVGPSWLRFYLRPGAVAKGRLLQYSQQSGIKGSGFRVCRLDRAAAEVGRHSDPSSLKLALVEEPQSRGQEGDDRRRLVLRPGEYRHGARLVVVFKKAGELVLVIQPGEQVTADRPGMAVSQAVVKPLVVTIVEALLVQGPFEVPINLGHKGEGRIFLADRRGRLRPEWVRRQSPSALKNVRQQQHRHVAAHTVALAGNADQLVDPRLLQFGIGVVELQGIRPARKVGIAPIGQYLRSAVGLDPQVVRRCLRQRLLAAVDIELGMGLDPRMVRGGMVRHEIEHQLDAAARQSLAELPQRQLPAHRLGDGVGGDRKAGAADVVLAQIGQYGRELGAPF